MPVERLFDIFVSDQPRQVVHGVTIELDWLRGEGIEPLRSEIRRRLDQKVGTGELGHLEWLLTYIDRMPGREHRKQWLRAAVRWRLHPGEEAGDIQSARITAGLVGPVVEAAGQTFGGGAVTALLGRDRARDIEASIGAFAWGTWRGLGREIPSDDLDGLAARFVLGWGLSAAFPPYFLAGVNWGVAKLFGDMASTVGSASRLALATEIQQRAGLSEIPVVGPWARREVAQATEVLAALEAIVEKLATREGARTAHALGVRTSRAEARRIRRTLEGDWYLLPFRLGEYVGPALFEIVLFLSGVGELEALSAAARTLLRLPGLRRLQEVRRAVRFVSETIDEFVPRVRVGYHASGVPTRSFETVAEAERYWTQVQETHGRMRLDFEPAFANPQVAEAFWTARRRTAQAVEARLAGPVRRYGPVAAERSLRTHLRARWERQGVSLVKAVPNRPTAGLRSMGFIDVEDVLRQPGAKGLFTESRVLAGRRLDDVAELIGYDPELLRQTDGATFLVLDGLPGVDEFVLVHPSGYTIVPEGGMQFPGVPLHPEFPPGQGVLQVRVIPKLPVARVVRVPPGGRLPSNL